MIPSSDALSRSHLTATGDRAKPCRGLLRRDKTHTTHWLMEVELLRSANVFIVPHTLCTLFFSMIDMSQNVVCTGHFGSSSYLVAFAGRACTASGSTSASSEMGPRKQSRRRRRRHTISPLKRNCPHFKRGWCTHHRHRGLGFAGSARSDASLITHGLKALMPTSPDASTSFPKVRPRSVTFVASPHPGGLSVHITSVIDGHLPPSPTTHGVVH